MNDFLAKVSSHIKAHRLHHHADVLSLRHRAEDTPEPLPFLKDFRGGELNVIAEIKYASPSEGVIRDEAIFGPRMPETIAAGYLDAGAKALSILTEPQWFQGDTAYIQRVRNAFPAAAILMKDFYIAEEQFYLARAVGANAVLLIAAMLSPMQYSDFHGLALSLGLTPLTEVHNAEELVMVMPYAPALLGINNRNLKTLKTDLDVGIELRRAIPAEQRCICESGIATVSDIRKMVSAGFDSFLIGTGFMRHPEPGVKLRELLNACGDA